MENDIFEGVFEIIGDVWVGGGGGKLCKKRNSYFFKVSGQYLEDLQVFLV